MTTRNGAPADGVVADLNGQSILVTGASRGLGAAIARAAGARGARIIALARTHAGLEEVDDAIRSAGGPAASLIAVDLRDHDALARLGPALKERFGHLDSFVHAAATTHGLSRLWDTSPGEFDTAVYLATSVAHRLIHALHPLLTLADRPRVGFVTDTTPPDPPAFWAHYAAGKAALNTIAAAYAAEAAPTGICVATLDPGPMTTALRGRSFPGDDPGQPVDPDGPARWLVERWLCAKSLRPGPLTTLHYEDFVEA